MTKNEKQWVTGCLKKVSIDNLEKAKEFAQKKANEFNTSFSIYICPDCSQLHLTKNIKSSGRYKSIAIRRPKTINRNKNSFNKFTEKELIDIKSNLKGKKMKQVAKKLGVSTSSLKKQLKEAGLL